MLYIYIYPGYTVAVIIIVRSNNITGSSNSSNSSNSNSTLPPASSVLSRSTASASKLSWGARSDNDDNYQLSSNLRGGGG